MRGGWGSFVEEAVGVGMEMGCGRRRWVVDGNCWGWILYFGGGDFIGRWNGGMGSGFEYTG